MKSLIVSVSKDKIVQISHKWPKFLRPPSPGAPACGFRGWSSSASQGDHPLLAEGWKGWVARGFWAEACQALIEKCGDQIMMVSLIKVWSNRVQEIKNRSLPESASSSTWTAPKPPAASASVWRTPASLISTRRVVPPRGLPGRPPAPTWCSWESWGRSRYLMIFDAFSTFWKGWKLKGL